MANNEKFPWMHNVTNANELTYIDEESVKAMEDKHEKISKMLEGYLELDLKNQTDEKKDEIYNTIKGEWDEYQELLRGTLYNTNLSVEEYRYLRTYILNKVTYGQENIFLGHKVNQEIFIPYGDRGKTNEKGETQPFMLTIDQMTTVSTLMSDMTVVGLNGKGPMNFASILSKFGSMSQTFSKYLEKSKELSAIVTQVASAMDELSSEKLAELEAAESEKNDDAIANQKEEKTKPVAKKKRAPRKKKDPAKVVEMEAEKS